MVQNNDRHPGNTAVMPSVFGNGHSYCVFDFGHAFRGAKWTKSTLKQTYRVMAPITQFCLIADRIDAPGDFDRFLKEFELHIAEWLDEFLAILPPDMGPDARADVEAVKICPGRAKTEHSRKGHTECAYFAVTVTMPDYQFSTIKAVPQSARKEPVAIGVIIYDPKKGEAYRKFTDNWPEVRRRTGMPTFPDLKAMAKEDPIKVSDGYLDALSGDKFPDSLLVTRPNNLMPFYTPHDALEWTFETHVGLPAREDKRDALSQRVDTLLREQIMTMQFPTGSYRQRYEFNIKSPSVMFPHVFLKDAVPYVALFAVSVKSTSATTVIKSRIGDIASIEKWHTTDVSFKMWAAGAKDGDDLALSAAHGMAERLEKWNVEVVYQYGVRDVLAEIKDRVSPVQTIWPR